jgi:hypothetical protein
VLREDHFFIYATAQERLPQSFAGGRWQVEDRKGAWALGLVGETPRLLRALTHRKYECFQSNQSATLLDSGRDTFDPETGGWFKVAINGCDKGQCARCSSYDNKAKCTWAELYVTLFDEKVPLPKGAIIGMVVLATVVIFFVCLVGFICSRKNCQPTKAAKPDKNTVAADGEEASLGGRSC